MNITPGLRAERTTARTAVVAIVSGVVLAAWLVGTCKAALSGLVQPSAIAYAAISHQL